MWEKVWIVRGWCRGGSSINNGYFFGDVPKQIRSPTSFSRSPCSVVLQRNLMFAASSGVILRSESLSMDYWGKIL